MALSHGITDLNGAPAAARPVLEVDHAAVSYQHVRAHTVVQAIDMVSLSVHENELVCIVGPSGCGKSTLLSAIAGLVPLTRGAIRIEGKPVSRPGPDRAMVFQQASLLPWRSVLGNVTYWLELQGITRKKAVEVARAQIRLVGLSNFEQAYPHEMSGGMQQRVNLARALAVDPQILLLDEPFAALDAQTREFMQLELLKVLGVARKTVLFVTHQIGEAIYLADKVVVMSRSPGRVIDVVPVELERPRSLDVKHSAEFQRLEKRIWDQVVKEVLETGDFASAR
jgi:NitT/TauT family transport system ATP-binding protein